MSSHRKIAITVGVLFIIATAGGVASGITLMPVFEDADFLTQAYEHGNQMILGSLFYFVMAVAVAAIPVVIYPVLKKFNQMLALGYVAARLAEGMLFLIQVVAFLTIWSLSQSAAAVGAPDAAYLQTTGEIIKAAGSWAGELLGGLVFPLSVLMVNYVLYRSRLVPRWLAAWGFIGAFPFWVAAGAILTPTNLDILYAPLALEEMVFALWLIVKGFNPEAIAAVEADA